MPVTSTANLKKGSQTVLGAYRGATPAYNARTFYRDFAQLKSLNHGIGPAITFTRASNATYFDANGVLQTASNDVPRFDHDPATGASRGLLIEESRTNHCTNSEASGAIGTNGPTGWFVSGTPFNGLSRTVTQGTVNGMSYIDVRWQGTTTSGPFVIQFDPRSSPGATASSGQSWTASVYIAIQNGTLPLGSVLKIYARGRDSSGIVNENNPTTVSPISALSRYTTTTPIVNASTSQVTFDIRLETVPTATAVDFTLRIAAPQLEQGAFPTSYIPTTTAAATRSADSAVVTPISSFYNQSEGTLFAEFSRYQTAGISNFLHFAGASPSQVVLETNGTAPSTAQRFLIETGAGAQANISFSGVAANTIYRLVGGYALNSFQAAQNGTLGTEDTLGSLPAVSRMNVGAGQYEAGGMFKVLNGHIRKIAYYPRRLSNALLQQLTT